MALRSDGRGDGLVSAATALRLAADEKKESGTGLRWQWYILPITPHLRDHGGNALGDNAENRSSIRVLRA